MLSGPKLAIWLPLVYFSKSCGTDMRRIRMLEECALQQQDYPVEFVELYSHGSLPSRNVSMEIDFVKPWEFQVYLPSGEMIISLMYYFTFHWFDDRLNNASLDCKDIYMPNLLVVGDGASYSPVKADGSVSILHGPDPDEVDEHVSIAQDNMSSEWRMMFRAMLTVREQWRYSLYPFDEQQFSTNFSFNRWDVRFVGCTDQSRYHMWDIRQGERTSHSVPVSERSVVQRFLLADEWSLPPSWLELNDPWTGIWARGQCDMIMHLERNPAVYFLKSILLDVIVVLSGLSATLLNPEVPPYLGARCGMLMTAMLMMINKGSRRDLGFGGLGYMLVLDWLAVFNIAVLLASLVLSLSVHFLITHGHPTRAKTLNRAIRVVSFALYLFGLIFFLMYFMTEDAKAVTVAATLGGALLLAGGLLYVIFDSRRRKRRLQCLALEVLRTIGSEQLRNAGLKRLFIDFAGGENKLLHARDTRVLFQMLSPVLRGTRLADGEADSILMMLHLNAPGGSSLADVQRAVEVLIGSMEGSREIGRSSRNTWRSSSRKEYDDGGDADASDM